MFTEASLENLFYSASAAQRSHQEASRSRYLASKLNIFLAGIEQYAKAMDVLSQASQFQKYFAVLMDMLEHIGDVLPRFQAYETLFSSSTRLMQSLSNAYLEMIKFCTSVKAAFLKARKSDSYSHIHCTGSIMVFYTNYHLEGSTRRCSSEYHGDLSSSNLERFQKTVNGIESQ